MDLRFYLRQKLSSNFNLKFCPTQGFVRNNILHIVTMVFQLEKYLYTIIHVFFVFPQTAKIVMFCNTFFQKIWHVEKNLSGISTSADVFIGSIWRATGPWFSGKLNQLENKRDQRIIFYFHFHFMSFCVHAVHLPWKQRSGCPTYWLNEDVYIGIYGI